MATVPTAPLCCQSTSAAGLLSLLLESEWSLRVHALRKLNEVVDRFWPEIADSLSEIEYLYEDESFPERRLAALVISKVYYHLEEYDDALRYALGVGPLFDISEKSQYTRITVAKCIDEYVKHRVEMYEKEAREVVESKQHPSILHEEILPKSSTKMEDVTAIDPRLEAIVERILDMCIQCGDERQALGIAFDARRLDKVKEIIMHSSGLLSILEYCLHNAHTLIATKLFRGEVFSLLSSIYRTLPADVFEGEYPNFCKCLYYEKEFEETAKILSNLIRKGGDSILMAYQIAFDLVDFEDQAFLKSVLHHPLLELPQIAVEIPPEGLTTPSHVSTTPPPVENGIEATEAEEDTAMCTEETSLPLLNTSEKATMAKLRYILTGEASIELRLQFLHRNNNSDLHLLQSYKVSVDLRNSLTHHAVIIAHGLMEAGTTRDIFLRSNLEWLARATNWAKFSATASLGVLNK
ncbi:Proteasome/cyclosome repeat-containing protein, partial [Cardiosporidium cionae]